MSDPNILNIDDPSISSEDTTNDLRLTLDQIIRQQTTSHDDVVIPESPGSPIDFFAIHNRNPKTDLKVRIQAVVTNIKQPLPVNKNYKPCEIVEFQS